MKVNFRIVIGFIVHLNVFFFAHTDQFPLALTIKEDGNDFNKAEDAQDPKDLNVFDPSTKWQTLKPGQAVTAGSHVRLNLQTGQREVKLGDEEYLPGRKSMQGMLYKQTPLFTSQELKQALKKFKGVDDTTKRNSEQGKESSQTLFRSMDELRRDLAMSDLLVETDVQIMSKLLSKFSSTNTTMEQRVAALLDLEYLVHQVDNAHNLVLMGGLELVNDALNNTDFRLQESAAFVLGAAVSSNPSVQNAALETGTLQKLLIMLATPRPMTVKKKVLVELFQAKGAEVLCVRIITLLYDLITEQDMISQTGIDPHTTHQKHFQQYDYIPLFPMLVEQGWCSLVPEILSCPDHDSREKALQTLLALLPHCQTLFLRNPTLTTSLGLLQKQYQELALGERSLGEDDGYFDEILVLVESVMLKIQ
ncbi:nucleotide exchange factor SIL1 isoform X2 [Tachysurus fulvidraco]|uniref:nucleotide exchange factor SIL1 isoform X2 n=1 Tax=Tachysurus fulvidraco TaxID=1234273 RepID=UPI000F507BA6|nr:nucleotide exchange factor SIL1 isoform X2 [Tachysurus fulvidraco]